MDTVSVCEVAAVRQHGAMDFTTPPTDLDAVRMYRLQRVRDALIERDLAGIVMWDQLNTRYATDVTNMQVWCMHNEARYVYVPAEGPVVVWDYGGKTFLSEGVPSVDVVRPVKSFLYFFAGNTMQERARAWADDIDDVIRQTNGGNKRIAMDRSAPLAVYELQRLGYEIHDGFEVMENARRKKSDGEIALMRHSIDVCQAAVKRMAEAMRPGMTENALWAELHHGNIEFGGEWIETRLLASGPRTNPWFQESSMRVIEKGDMVSLDTDLVGPYGYCCDMSRSWVCDAKPSDAQKRLFEFAVEHVEYNKRLLQPGRSFREITELLQPLPDEYVAQRYGVAMHGVGLCDEYPSIYYPMDYDAVGYDDILEPGMVMCVEVLAARDGEGEAVKLEEQVLVTETGFEQLTSYPIDEGWT
jgi:Xaa-Pro dipeptidase